MIFGIVLAIIMSQRSQQNSFEVASVIAPVAATIILFFTSNKFRTQRLHKKLEGYWKYYSISNTDFEGKEQKFTTPRIVKIIEEDGELKLFGVICDKENVPMFESKTGEVFVSTIGKSKGGLVYSYESPDSSQRTKIKGIAYLTWRNSYKSAQVNVMKGIYCGTLTGDQGTLTYLRISEEEYNRHCNSTFI